MTTKRWMYALFLWCFFWSTGTWAAGTQSTKTVSNVITEVRYAINESTADFWTDAELTAYINQGLQSLAARSRCYEVAERYVISSGTSTYAIGVNYIDINEAVLQTGTTAYHSLLRGNRKGVGSPGINQNYPLYFYENKGHIGFYPIKDTSDETATGTTAYVLYVALPDTHTGTSTVQLPAYLDQAIVNYATARALYKIPTAEASSMAKNIMQSAYDEADRYRLDFKDKPRETLWDVLIPTMKGTNEAVR